MYELSAAAISAKMDAIRGLGQTGEAMIVGPDHLMRTQSRFATDSDVLVTNIPSDVIDQAVGGQTASGIVPALRGERMVALAAPFELHGTKWAITAVENEAE